MRLNKKVETAQIRLSEKVARRLKARAAMLGKPMRVTADEVVDAGLNATK